MDNLSILASYYGIMGLRVNTSVKVGGIYILPNDVQNYFGNFAQRFVNFTHHEVFQFQFLGTATGIRYRGRYFTISTNHQKNLGDHGQLGILCHDGKSAAAPKAMWPITFLNEVVRPDEYDFVIYEYELEDYDNGPTAQQFFPVTSNESFRIDTRTLCLNLGYPTRLQNVDYNEGVVENLLSSNFVKFIGNIESNILGFQTINSERFFEDGMSGSPIIGLIEKSGIIEATWLGIVIRGADFSQNGRAISSRKILNTFDKILFGEV